MKRFILEQKVEDICFKKKETENTEIKYAETEKMERIPVEEVQLFIFDNGIALFSMLLVYENVQTPYIYDFINPSYVNDQKEDLRKNVVSLVKSIHVNGRENVLSLYVGSEDMAVKESYVFNAAFVTKRFRDLETLDKTTFDAHKLIDLSREFEDASETDIAYTYGAKDVELNTYRWGACISSQSISYVYAVIELPEDKEKKRQLIQEGTTDDLLLTILVLYQKNTCMLLNEKIQETINVGMQYDSFKKIMQLKHETLLFQATGTLAPSQVSRWNNVCETYRKLLEVNGVNEALSEIEEKIDLIKDEQERQASEMQNYIATVIAVFGFISIVAAVLQIVDLMQGGSMGMMTAMACSCVGVVLFNDHEKTIGCKERYGVTKK